MKFGFGKNIIVIDDEYVNYMKYEKILSILNEKIMCLGVLKGFVMNCC